MPRRSIYVRRTDRRERSIEPLFHWSRALCMGGSWRRRALYVCIMYICMCTDQYIYIYIYTLYAPDGVFTDRKLLFELQSMHEV